MSNRQFSVIVFLLAAILAFQCYLLMRTNAAGRNAEQAEEIAASIEDRFSSNPFSASKNPFR